MSLSTLELNYVQPISISYTQELDGGGTKFGLEYVPIIQSRYPSRIFKKCYEWCSGPGFIGFGILSSGQCSTLCFSDIYQPAIDCVNVTVEQNKLNGIVSSYTTGDLALLPLTEQFDLVVSNPPHYAEVRDYATENEKRICVDADWEAHKNFFAHIRDHLLPDGVILLQENMKGSTAETFEPFIEAAGLKITDWFKSPSYFSTTGKAQIYYIEIKHK